MVTISGRLNASITGLIRFTPDHPFVSPETNPKTLVSLPIEAAITNGQFSINVPQSENLAGQGIETESITYKIELFRTDSVVIFYLLDGTEYTGTSHLHTDGLYYTGSVHDATSRRLDRVASGKNVLFTEPIHAIAPDSATTVDFTDLVAIPAQEPHLSITLFRLANILTTEQVYKERISTKINFRGAYSAVSAYVFGDLVRYNGNTYLWINASSLAGQTPPLTGDDAYWQMQASKGDPGGTGAQSIGYNPSTWQNSNEAASRADVRQAIASVSVAQPDLSPYALKSETAPNTDAYIQGSLKRSALIYPVAAAQRANEVPTAQYVEDALAAIGSGFLPKPLIYGAVSSHPAIGATAAVIWNTVYSNTTNNALNSSNGRFTVPETGSYVFLVMVTLRATASFAANTKRMTLRSYLYRVSPNAIEVGNFFKIDTSATTVEIERSQPGLRFQQQLNAGEIYEIRVQFDAYDASINSQSIAAGVGNNYLLIWRAK